MLTIETIKGYLDNVNTYISEHYKNIEIDDFRCFSQTFPDTTIGFGGYGGQTFTSAFVIIVEAYANNAVPMFFVFFNGRHAYSVVNPTEEFYHDMFNNYMKSIHEALNRYNNKK